MSIGMMMKTHNEHRDNDEKSLITAAPKNTR